MIALWFVLKVHDVVLGKTFESEEKDLNKLNKETLFVFIIYLKGKTILSWDGLLVNQEQLIKKLLYISYQSVVK